MKEIKLQQIQRIVFFAVFLTLALTSFAQNPANYEDVVYLKNGNIYHGLIIEQVPNVSLKIQTHERNVFAVQLNEVEKITKEEMPNNFYRDGYFRGELDKPNLNEKPKLPTKLNGVYLNWGLGLGGSSFGGITGTMSVGAKIFTKKAKESTKKVHIGADVFGVIGGVVGDGIAGVFDANAGATFAWRLKDGYKGNLYLTPYSGVNLFTGQGSNIDHFTTVTFPVGLKFEYNRGKFICGASASAGVGVEKTQFFKYVQAASAGRFMLFVGMKF